MTKVERLEKRLEQLSGAGNVWIPSWLSAVGSGEEIAEWKAISRSYRREDLSERRLEFQREMREKYPDMPLTVEEQEEAGVERLRSDIAMQRREGLIREPSSSETWRINA